MANTLCVSKCGWLIVLQIGDAELACQNGILRLFTALYGCVDGVRIYNHAAEEVEIILILY